MHTSGKSKYLSVKSKRNCLGVTETMRLNRVFIARAMGQLMLSYRHPAAMSAGVTRGYPDLYFIELGFHFVFVLLEPQTRLR